MAPLTLGVVQLRDAGWRALASPVVALVHAASILPDSLEHVVDAIVKESNISLAAVLAPEHGFRGTKQAEHGDPDVSIDPKTNLTVYSVYRRNSSALARILNMTQAKTVLVDLVDVGTRLYTFVWTLYDLMAAGAAMSLAPKFLIADRPNPLGGAVVEGPVLDTTCCASRYGRLPVPHRHGMTVGELAKFMQTTLGSRAPDVEVVRLLGWYVLRLKARKSRPERAVIPVCISSPVP